MMLKRVVSGGELRAASFDPASNTIEVVFATETPVLRVVPDGSTYWEVLSCQPGAVDLTRLNAGAPLLDSHDMLGGVDAVIGSVVPGTARIDSRKGVAKVLLSSAAGDADRVAKIRDGVLRNISVGYTRREYVPERAGDDGIPVRRYTKWAPYEISVVGVPADPAAQVRSLGGETIAARVVREAGERRAGFIEEALRHRLAGGDLSDGAREYRDLTLISIARDFLSEAGADVRGKAPSEIAAMATTRANTTVDFPTILSNVVNTTLRAAYEAAPATWRPLVKEVSVSDFSEISRVAIDAAPRLDRVGEYQEYRRADLSDASTESYAVASYGKIVSISRQALVNDDIYAFGRLGQNFAAQAAQIESDLVWAQILSNPTMADGVPLFHATHKNLAAGSDFDLLALKILQARMRKQVAPAGWTLNLSPKFLIVPVELQTSAEQLLKAEVFTAIFDDAPPPSLQALEIISEPRLDLGFTDPQNGRAVAGGSAFFMAAAPGSIDTVEVAYIDGRREVNLETRVGFDIDGMEFRARLDVGAKVIDHRAFVKNPGQ
ncbi:HK97 family phage prohead protease [Ancylobacter sp. 6x-1]|uniref:HK97 family phage prohead protease n=1 Tax=Ancylobacter crimeensis TaxID=2579147 RepID=A0ABT0DD01_9HYPH|nr:HK97 family phage prohead protease [Ancylobacter crimeensis]MCK0197749.1 HK97 family phage prohead protease [Ancylobacter crimeensis]